MATALQKKARRRGQARIDQQKIDRFRKSDPGSNLGDDEILALKPKAKAKAKKKKGRKALDVTDLPGLIRKRKKQLGNVFE